MNATTGLECPVKGRSGPLHRGAIRGQQSLADRRGDRAEPGQPPQPQQRQHGDRGRAGRQRQVAQAEGGGEPPLRMPGELLAMACGRWNSASAATSSSSGAITLTTARASLQRRSRTIHDERVACLTRLTSMRPRIRAAPVTRSAQSATCWPERSAQATGFGARIRAS